MTALPATRALELEPDRGVLRVWLARPAARNAISRELSEELVRVLDAVAADRAVRVIVLRGRGGTFCAGADVAEVGAALAAAAPAGDDPLLEANRRFGELLLRLEAAPQAVVAVVEGAAMGGGVGLVCAADVALARADARFRLPEVTLGVPPAQIAPGLIRRIGPSQATRLALTAARFDGHEAARLGLVHEVCETAEALDAALAETVARLLEGAPAAIAATKRLLAAAARKDRDAFVEAAAMAFAHAARGPEGIEGVRAILEKRRPRWAPEQP